MGPSKDDCGLLVSTLLLTPWPRSLCSIVGTDWSRGIAIWGLENPDLVFPENAYFLAEILWTWIWLVQLDI